MTGRKQVRAVVLAALLVMSSFSMVGAGAATAPTGNASETTFHVTQGQNCYPVTALGDGTQTVEAFYDYRNPETNPESYNYASYGTTHLQSNQESKLFVYNGANGYSLVLLHDKFSEDGSDGSHASTVTFTMSGMPGDGSWAVRDDSYENGTQDDNWDMDGSTHVIDWMWAPDRNDGGAFLGIADAEITIDPGFNTEANQWGSWPHSDNPEDRMTSWSLIDADETEQELDMSQSLTIAQGSCPSNSGPTADLSVSDTTVANDEAVTFDASGSSDDTGIASYEWDFGDGNTATGPTAEHSYDAPGEYTVTLTVTDDDGNADTATETVTVEDTSPDVSSFSLWSSDNETVEVVFYSSSSITDIEVEVTDENGTTVATLTEADFTVTDAGDEDEYRATANVESSASYTATLLKAADADGNDAANGQTGQTYVGPVDGSIEFVNATTAKVTGEFERVWVQEKWYNELGPATDYYDVQNVSGTTIITANSEGALNGTAIHDIAAAKHANDGEHDLQKKNPYRNLVQPYSLNLSVGNVTETGDGVYDVTFEYENRNDGEMIVENSEFTSGNVEGEAPTTSSFETFYPGKNAITVTWTPAANDERVTLEVNQSNFGLDDVSASTEPASAYGGIGDGGDDGDDGNDGNDSPAEGAPTAKLSLSNQTVDFYDKVGLDAGASTDDGDIVEYRWKFGNDVTRVTPDDGTGEKNAHRIWHEVYGVYDEPGTYTASVTVVDDDGNTDTATRKITVERNDHTAPNATLRVPDEVTVGEEFSVKATDFTEDLNRLKHVCWTFGHNHGEAEGATASYTYDEVGTKTITLHLKDKAGNSKMVETTIEVTKADDGSNDPSDPPADDPNDDPNDDPKNDPKNDPIDDDPNDGSTGGSIPTADPPADDSNDGDQTPKKAAFEDTEGTYGEIVLQSDATDAAVEVRENVPDDVRQPTVELDGFEALTYVTVSGDEEFNATFTVSKDRLESANATPDAVSLFRYDEGSWNAVETAMLNETAAAYEFGANATNGTYAIGVGVPSTAVEDLRVATDRVAPGDEVTVVVTVANDGHASGTQDVALTVDGETVATKTVSVPARSTEEVEFTQSFDAPGVYAVSAGDANAEIVVEGIETETTTDADDETATTTTTETADTDGPGVPGFGVGAALAALAAAALLARRKA